LGKQSARCFILRIAGQSRKGAQTKQNGYKGRRASHGGEL
jgi:hypothetical protein